MPAQFELLDLYTKIERVEANGQNWVGAARNIANNGLIIGDVAEGGMMRAVTWVQSLSMTYFELGQYSEIWAIGYVINSTGLAGGELRPPETAFAEGAQVDLESVPLIWQGNSLAHHPQPLPTRPTGAVMPVCPAPIRWISVNGRWQPWRTAVPSQRVPSGMP